LTNCHFSFFDKLGPKDDLLSRFNPIEWTTTSTSI
jgi:hypothetical protein